MPLGARVERFVDSVAQVSRSRWFARHGFSVSDPRPMSGIQRAGHFAAGLGYALHDYLFTSKGFAPNLTQIPTETFPPSENLQPRRVHVAPSGVYGIGGTTFAMSVPDSSDGGSRRIDASEVARRVFSIVRMNVDEDFTVQRLSTVLGDIFRGDVDREMLLDALELLRVDKKVDFNGSVVRFYNQEAIIKEAGAALSRELVKVETLHRLAEVVADATSGLFRNVDFYLRDGDSDEMLIVAGDREGSKYARWKGQVPQSMLNYLLTRRQTFRYVENLAANASDDGPISRADAAEYGRRFVNPAEAGYCASSVPGTKHGIAFKLSEWIPAGSEGNARRFYGVRARGDVEAVDRAISELALTVAKKTAEIVDGESMKTVWAREEASSPVARTQKKSKVPKPGEPGYEEWVDRNEATMRVFYDKFTGVFAHICKLSRAYQMSVREGIARVIDDVRAAWPGEEIAFVDSGVGSAYFLERFVDEARSSGVSVRGKAIDLSASAVTIAREVCRRKGFAEVDVDRGNMAKMTRPDNLARPVALGLQRVIFLNYVLQYVPIQDVLREANRALAMNGRLLVTNFKPKESMRWNEFWTNVRASWEAGRTKAFGHGRLFEMVRYFGMFIIHARDIVRFAKGIDQDVLAGVIPENPNREELMAYLEAAGFEIISAGDTHQHAAYQFYAKKARQIG